MRAGLAPSFYLVCVQIEHISSVLDVLLLAHITLVLAKEEGSRCLDYYLSYRNNQYPFKNTCLDACD